MIAMLEYTEDVGIADAATVASDELVLHTEVLSAYGIGKHTMLEILWEP